MVKNIEFIPANSPLITPESKNAMFNNLKMWLADIEEEINNEGGKIIVYVHSTANNHIELVNVSDELKDKFKSVEKNYIHR